MSNSPKTEIGDLDEKLKLTNTQIKTIWIPVDFRSTLVSKFPRQETDSRRSLQSKWIKKNVRVLIFHWC